MIKVILLLLTLATVVLSQPGSNSNSEYEQSDDSESETNPKLRDGENEKMRAKILEIIDRNPTLYQSYKLQSILELTKVSRSKCRENWYTNWIDNVNMAWTDPDLKHFYRASFVRQANICTRLLELVVESKINRLSEDCEEKLTDMLEKAEELGYGNDDEDDEEANKEPQSYLPEYIRAKTGLYLYLKERTSSITMDITLDEVEAKAQTHIILPCRNIVDLLGETFNSKYLDLAESALVFGVEIRQPLLMVTSYSTFNWCDKVLQGYKEWADSQN